MTVTLPASSASPVSWRMPEVFMLRTAGLPIEVADRLAFDRTAGWARRVLDREDRLRATGRDLADALGAAVAGNLDDDALRRKLIRLRRDVFNLRRPHPADPAAWPADRLGADTHARLAEWLADWGAYRTELAEGAALLDTELRERRGLLRELALDPDLRGGILLASPSLDQYLPGYLTAGATLGKRARRAERSLLEYAFRTACKTSPFSRLTTVNVGTFTDDAGGLLDVDPAPGAPKHGTARLNLAALGRLSTIVLAEESLRADLPVTVTSGWRIEHGRLRYLRRRRTASEDGDAAITLESIHESLFVLPTGRMLHDILTALDGGRVARMADLVAELAVDGRPADEVAQYLHHLLRVGLLVVPTLHLDIHADDPVDGYRAALRAVDRGWADKLAARVAAANRLAAGYSGHDVAGRRHALAAIRDELAAAHADLGRPDIPVPRTLLYEDAALRTRTPVTADRGRWEREALPGLRALARIMPVFDVNLPRRLAIKGFFRARYGAGGRCEDLLTFAHEFQQDFFEHYTGRLMRRRAFDADNTYVRQENWFRQPEITALDDARLEVARRMNEAYAALPPGAEELVLDDAFMTEVAALVPQTLGVLDPRSFFLQIAERDGRGRLVVNRVYSGMTLLFSRFAHLFGEERLADRLRAELARLAPPGAVLAELKGGYDATNLNLHPAVTPYELVCPGEISFRPAAEQIHMDDLRVEHDPDADRLLLRSRRLDAEVIPVYLGFLLPMALPEVQQVLLTFAYLGMAQPDLWAGTTVPLPGTGMVGYPRISHGDLVLQRRMWKLHPGFLPATRTPDQSEADWFLGWQRWRRENRLPRRVFATPEGSRLTPAAEDAPPAGRPDHKPLYVDFDSLFSVRLLDATARAAGSRLVLTEMLPDRDEQVLRGPAGTYVTELTVELNGVRAGEVEQ
ncbi:lantibiotic dehydratase family protein [Micromonospora sp. PLK6-60]|uniref:lantibiotic dehydratase n=1 Tax=Micromonospora sp. PLK6-60 TaxID=2873383 RepID=UPI001CA61970|nr:lantibiotic dehydratase [Micromonospora sp. PLK6-60]MBY8872563.1 lantibiotic dehydratase family protein [Micromonospora sp. PLK6-60]